MTAAIVAIVATAVPSLANVMTPLEPPVPVVAPVVTTMLPPVLTLPLPVKRLVTLMPAELADVLAVPVVAPVHVPDPDAIVTEGMANGRADDERQTFVVGPGRLRRGQGARENAGAEQNDGCLQHTCLQVISGTPKVATGTESTLNPNCRKPERTLRHLHA